MSPSIGSRKARTAENALVQPKLAGRSPLAQLLHALNQPLTGLQCSMEVAMASPRTPEQYIRGLHEGLELTERMRALVQAIREVTDLDEENNGRENHDPGHIKDKDKDKEKNEEKVDEAIELNGLLRETLDDLAPVAEVKSVGLKLDCSPGSCWVVRARRRTVATAAFRLLESALSLASRGSVLVLDVGGETGGTRTGAWFRVRWLAGCPPSGFSPPELGLLVAQAGLEHVGAAWTRERKEGVETVMVRVPGVRNRHRHG